MEERPDRGWSIAYAVVAALLALMVCFSASTKLTRHPGAVHSIHEVIGVPMSLFPVLAGLEIAGGVGLLLGIFRPRLGVAAGVGLVLYFVGAMLAHVSAGDWKGLTAPIVPLLLSMTVLFLRVASLRRARA